VRYSVGWPVCPVRSTGRLLAGAGVPETASMTVARFKLFDHFEVCLYNWHEYHLCDTVTGFDGIRGSAPVPAGHHDLALVVAVDQADSVAKHDAVLMPQAGARQNYRGEFRIGDVYRHTTRDQLAQAWVECQCLIQTGAQVDAGRAVGGVVGPGELVAKTRVKNS